MATTMTQKMFATEFGDDILLKIIVPDATIEKVYTIGRMDNIRYEDSEEIKEARGIGTKYRRDARLTNFRGIFRCTLNPTALNLGIVQYALGARTPSGEDVQGNVDNWMMMDSIFKGDITPPDMLIGNRYVVPYRFRIEITNVRTGFSDILFDVLFSRRAKEVRQGEFTVFEIDGEYTYSKLSSDVLHDKSYQA